MLYSRAKKCLRFCHTPRILIANSRGQSIPSFGVRGSGEGSSGEFKDGKGKDSTDEGSSKLDMPFYGGVKIL